MPLTAQHREAGLLDLTAPVLAVAWTALHRVRPRAPLTCRECGHGLHAKVSHGGYRFFAHDARAPDCSLSQETLAHRLLKLELASAARQAGWHAELEVTGDGWRADVLSSAPDGARRIAWEAQLASITIDEIQRRTEGLRSDGVEVCWVTDKDAPWMGHVPAVRVARGASAQGRGDGASDQVDFGDELSVIDGAAIFESDWCPSRDECTILAQHGLGGDVGPCPGHGQWDRPEPLRLGLFVRAVYSGSVRIVQTSARGPRPLRRHRSGPWMWTTRSHYLAEVQQQQAQEARRLWMEPLEAAQAERERRRQEHAENIARLLNRQKALTGPAVELVAARARGYVGVRDASPDWAMGVPLFVHDQPQAVLSPVAARVVGGVRARLASLTIFVASDAERWRLARVCVPEQDIQVIQATIPEPSTPHSKDGEVPRSVINSLLRSPP